MDLNKIINYKRSNVNFYDILGCSQSSDVDQINKEYKIRALQLHPDKNSDPASREKFVELQNAKEVLTDKATRKLYDAWLNSGINIPFEQFQNRRSHVFHWAAPRQTGKLSIQAEDKPGQACGQNSKDESTEMTPKDSLLEKFRRYEI
uniref:J domain-containing protein n=1 Tax=Aceria tosichella TaxID=561515 RepID=A0A6G1SIW2_9ACAR